MIYSYGYAVKTDSQCFSTNSLSFLTLTTNWLARILTRLIYHCILRCSSFAFDTAINIPFIQSLHGHSRSSAYTPDINPIARAEFEVVVYCYTFSRNCPSVHIHTRNTRTTRRRPLAIICRKIDLGTTSWIWIIDVSKHPKFSTVKYVK